MSSLCIVLIACGAVCLLFLVLTVLSGLVNEVDDDGRPS